MRFSDLPRWRGCCRYRQTNLSQIDLCREYGKRMETHWDTLTKVLDSWKASERRDCNGLPSSTIYRIPLSKCSEHRTSSITIWFQARGLWARKLGVASFEPIIQHQIVKGGKCPHGITWCDCMQLTLTTKDFLHMKQLLKLKRCAKWKSRGLASAQTLLAFFLALLLWRRSCRKIGHVWIRCEERPSLQHCRHTACFWHPCLCRLAGRLAKDQRSAGSGLERGWQTLAGREVQGWKWLWNLARWLACASASICIAWR